jgi:hypothetical protein
MGVHAGGTQTSNDLSVETHTIRAPASQSLGNFLMTPSPAAAGDGGTTNPLCQSYARRSSVQLGQYSLRFEI